MGQLTSHSRQVCNQPAVTDESAFGGFLGAFGGSIFGRIVSGGFAVATVVHGFHAGIATVIGSFATVIGSVAGVVSGIVGSRFLCRSSFH